MIGRALHRLYQLGRQWRRSEEGAAAAEVGLVVPLFTVLIAGIASYGFAMFQIVLFFNAVEAAANLAVVVGSGVTQTDLQNAVNRNYSGITISASQLSCYCATASSSGPVACNAITLKCTDGTVGGTYESIRGTYTISAPPPGVTASWSRTVYVRVQ